MPWKERTAMDERKEFIEEGKLNVDGFAELCRKYGITRQTGYKWVKRFQTEGERGLEEHSRAPRESPQAMGREVVDRVIGLRQQHPHWGPRKLRWYLQSHEPWQHWP